MIISIENDKIKQTARSEKAGISQPEILARLETFKIQKNTTSEELFMLFYWVI
jgi:hypothetical protein